MNPHENVGNKPVPCSTSPDADATLRLIAGLPAPEGLEDRVHARLRSAPRTGRVLEWPGTFRAESAWMRSAAAAAIAFVVVGGGWGVYSRVQPAKVIAMPPHLASPGGFTNAGAMRTPQTLNRPVLAPPSAHAGTAAKTPQVVQIPARKGKADQSLVKKDDPQTQ
ncbi:MAG: hypothetical protein WBE76_29435 [Terracidiphilus sp.]